MAAPSKIPVLREKPTMDLIPWETLDGAKINKLFPAQQVYQQISTIKATPAQIRNREFKASEIEKVKGLALHRIVVTDDQMAALIARFTKIEKVVLEGLQRITDRTLKVLGELKHLREVRISLCPSVTTIAPLPLENLQVAYFSIPGAPDIQDIRRLTSNPLLREADFGPKCLLTAEQLLCFKQTAVKVINVYQSPHIADAVVKELNRGRSPIRIKNQAETAPAVRSEDPMYLAEKEGHLNAPGQITNDELVFKIKSDKGEIKSAAIMGCGWIGYEAIIQIHHLRNLETLYFGNNPGATFRSLEVLFCPRPGRFSHLVEVRFRETFVSDQVLEYLAHLPVQIVHLSNCISFSPQGLEVLLKQSRSLKQIVLNGCPTIDALSFHQLSQIREDVIFRNEDRPDPLAIAWAKQEIREDKKFFFLPKFLGKEGSMPENIKLGGDTEQIDAYYAEQLQPLGIGPEEMDVSDWMRCDQFLQSYVNLRAIWALIINVIRQDHMRGHLPYNLQDAVHYFSSMDRRNDIREFDFEDWQVTGLPQSILRFDWPKLETVRLKWGEKVPKAFAKKCPRLKKS